MLEKYLHLPTLLVSFAIGILFMYMITPEPTVVMKFPNPYNANTNIYRNKNGDCFKYHVEQSTCPLDNKDVVKQPVMEDFV